MKSVFRMFLVSSCCPTPSLLPLRGEDGRREEEEPIAGSGRGSARNAVRHMPVPQAGEPGFIGRFDAALFNHETLLTSHCHGAVAVITLNRAARMNTFSNACLRGVSVALDLATEDAAVRVIVLTGAGQRAFSAGGDLASETEGAITGFKGAAAGAVTPESNPTSVAAVRSLRSGMAITGADDADADVGAASVIAGDGSASTMLMVVVLQLPLLLLTRPWHMYRAAAQHAESDTGGGERRVRRSWHGPRRCMRPAHRLRERAVPRRFSHGGHQRRLRFVVDAAADRRPGARARAAAAQHESEGGARVRDWAAGGGDDGGRPDTARAAAGGRAGGTCT